jgi:2-methylcitrate dehydratase PrpD
MGLTTEIATRLAELKFEDFGDEVVNEATRLVTDGLAVAVAGAHLDPIEVLWKVSQGLAGTGDASVIGHGAGCAADVAAYVNGAAMHVLDYEAMWSPATHATSTTLPAVLALAEERGADGQQVLTALIAGIEVQGRLRVASGEFESVTLKFHPPGAVGPIGAAAAGGVLLGLDETRMAHALGIAASRTGALMANVGTMTKCLHCGIAARHGVEAALLAEAGFTANTDILETPRGYAATLYPRWDPATFEDFGAPWRVMEPGYAIKLFPCQYGTHFAVNAALDVSSQLPESANIARVTLTTPPMPYVDKPQPRDGLDGKFSFQYTTACALLDGRVGIESFTDERRFAQDMNRMLPKIQVVQEDSIPGSFEEMHVTLDVELADGQILSARCNRPRGYIGTPIPEHDHLRKVKDCLSRGVDTSDVDRIVTWCRSLSSLDAPAVKQLMHVLRR